MIFQSHMQFKIRSMIMDNIYHNNFLPSHFLYFRPSGKLLHLDGTLRPVNVVLNKMEKVRKKDRLQKTKPNSNSNDLTHEKKRGRPPKILRPQKIVKWKYEIQFHLIFILFSYSMIKVNPIKTINVCNENTRPFKRN